MKDLKSTSAVSRRSFVRNASLAAAAFTIVPRHVLAARVTSRPATASTSRPSAAAGWALEPDGAVEPESRCDVRRGWAFVDSRFADIDQQIEGANKRASEATDAAQKDRAQQQIKDWRALQAQIPKTKRYTDYREMLAKQRNIDAVVDRDAGSHARAHCARAMDLGKHVYVQKPLAWSVEECRRLVQKAAATKLQTQMGNQSHSSDDARLVNEYIQSGAIGTVTEVHVWTNRPLGYWPAGHTAPGAAAAECQRSAVEHERRDDARRGRLRLLSTARTSSHGTCSSDPRASSNTTRSTIRSIGAAGPTGGVGAIGDMGAHLIDSSFWSLDLDYPTTSRPPRHRTTTIPTRWQCTTYYEFPAKGARRGESSPGTTADSRRRSRSRWATRSSIRAAGAVPRHEGQTLHDTYGFNPPAAEVPETKVPASRRNLRAYQDSHE